MRDPKRIPTILHKLHILWEKNPDLRLGQIVENAKAASKVSPKMDTFYIEDEVIEEGLDLLTKSE